MSDNKNGTLPPKLQDVFEKLSDDLTWLYSYWIVYKQLFRTSEKRVDLLNGSAKNFFYMVHRAFLDKIMLGLTKFGDPEGDGKKSNMSLKHLCKIVHEHGSDDLARLVQKLDDNYQQFYCPLKTYRNKVLAHRDLSTALSDHKDMPSVTFETIENALGTLRDFMNSIDGHFCDAETGYEHTILDGDGNGLAFCLAQGARYDELVRAQKIDFHDLANSQWDAATQSDPEGN